jgi:predicted RND superfamily exporter protein
MGMPNDQANVMPVITRIEDFDQRTGSVIERLIFNNRRILIWLCLFFTLACAILSLKLEMNASFEKMMPQSQPIVQNYLRNVASLRGLGNSVRIVVENTRGDIYDPKYLAFLREINDAVFLIPGVDRSFMKSLWMPVVRWTEITEQGYKGGTVMPDTYDESGRSLELLRLNIARAGIVGSLVGDDQRSSMIFVPLLSKDPDTGKEFDYKIFRDRLEKIKQKYESKYVRVHIIGFAKLVGDLINGLIQILIYFLAAAAIATLIIYVYTRCARSTLIVIGCSLIAVIWQLGVMKLLGFVIDPYSVLIPFLIFAIGVSHGAQKMNGIMQDIGRGTHRYIASRYTFRRLFMAGLTALLADAVGFAVLTAVDIPVIRLLAIEASIGVAILVFTNLILLPVVLSYTGVGQRAAERALRRCTGKHPLVRWLERFTRRRWASATLIFTALLTGGGLVVAQHLKIGDLDPGAPELRANSQYNKDNAYITTHYGLSSDQLAVIVSTPSNGLLTYETLLEMDRLEEILRDLPGVQTTVSAASLARAYTAGSFEGSPKWVTLNRDPFVSTDAVNYVFASNPEMLNDERSVGPVIAFLADHKAETLTRVLKAAEEFAAEHNTDDRKFLLAAGNSGIEAASNIAVANANHVMLLYVYLAVIALCYVTFRNWRAVLVAIVPLMVTSVLAEALMVKLGVGVKVATLPVVALGVGIGVDYSLYLLTVFLFYQRRGLSVTEAYSQALVFTGKVVALVGITLAAAVMTWVWSPIKFQADMGLLLAFMFLWNMLGALVLVPALAHFLLQPSLRNSGSTAEAFAR